MKKLFLIVLLVLVPVIAYSEQLTEYDKGMLIGELGFCAMTIDAYYEICYSNGVRTDTNLNGIDKLTKQKWDRSFSAFMKQQDKRTGQNTRNEAHKLINYVIKKTGGCNSTGMEKWFRGLQVKQDKNLNSFHAAQ
jgi:hypothetical protein